MKTSPLPCLTKFALFVAFGLGLAACGQLAAQDGPTRQYVLQADMEKVSKRIGEGKDAEKAVAATVKIIERRLGVGGTTPPRISYQGAGKILIEVSGESTKAEIEGVLGITPDLELRLVDPNASPENIREGIVSPKSEILPMKDGSEPVAVMRLGGISGEHIIDAVQGIDLYSNQPVVNLRLDSEGAKKLAALTGANIGKAMAVVLDNEVLIAPRINEAILGGSLQISGGFTIESAGALAIGLRSGALPVPFQIVEERVIE